MPAPRAVRRRSARDGRRDTRTPLEAAARWSACTRSSCVRQARQGDADGAAEATMRRFYALVRAPLGASYDVDRAAAAEVRWWVVHRQRHQYPDSSALVAAMAALYQEVYGLPAEAVQAAAEG